MLVLCSGMPSQSISMAILSMGIKNEQFSLVMLRTGVLLPQEEL
jgi:hypothetical protein